MKLFAMVNTAMVSENDIALETRKHSDRDKETSQFLPEIMHPSGGDDIFSLHARFNTVKIISNLLLRL
jgi:hypothetical protein